MAKSWLLHSRIQNPRGKGALFGSFNAWYDTDIEKHAFAYSEATGYGITSLLFLDKVEEDQVLLQQATAAGDWLANQAVENETGGVLCRMAHGQDDFVQRVCTFDNGMCLNALVNLFKATNNERYLNVGRKIADWLLTMQMPNGAFYPRYLVDSRQLEHQGDKWSKQSGTFHSKLAIGLLNIGAVLNDDSRYVVAARKVCDWAASKQLPDGRFVTDSGDDSTFIHPMCYTLEGLLVAGIVLGEERYLEAVRSGIEWIWTNRRCDGSFPAYYLNGEHLAVDSPDMSAQIIRLYVLLDALELTDGDRMGIVRSVGRLLDYQCISEDSRANGGFFSGSAWFTGEECDKTGKHVNSWVTMFVLQALHMHTKSLQIGNESVFYLV